MRNLPELFKTRLTLGLLPVTAGISLCLASQATLAQDDLSIGGGLTVVGQTISEETLADGYDPNDTTNEVDGTRVNYSIDVEFEKEMESGTVFVYLIGAEGDAVFDGVNADAEGGDFQDQLVGVAEAWYAHSMFDEMLTFTIGKIDPTGIYDGNEVANDQSTQFLADVFVNNSAILFPAYTPGMNLTMAFGEMADVSFGVFEDTETDDFTRNRAGEFEKAFVIGELGLHYEVFDNDGNFRMTVWDSGANERNGFAFNLDQGFGFDFFRIYSRLGFIGDTVDDPDAPETELSFSLGGDFTILDYHKLGFAYNMDAPASDQNDEISWFETYIDFELAEDTHLALDLQAVSNPDYDSTNDSFVVAGFRFQLGF